jgi:hypothetical protein
MSINTNLVSISLSNRPLGAFRLFPKWSGVVYTPVVPLECVRENLDLLIRENRVHQKEPKTGNVIGYIQDVHAAMNIIENSLFLYVETALSYDLFLDKYAWVPGDCPVCQEAIEFFDAEERLEHIIRCRWNKTRDIVAAAAKAMEPPRFLH